MRKAIVLLACFVLVLSAPVRVHAARDFVLSIAEPAKGDDCGYLLLWRQPSGTFTDDQLMLVYFWVSDDPMLKMQISCYGSSVRFVATQTASSNARIYIGYYSNAKIGYLTTLMPGQSFNDSFSGTYMGHQAYGSFQSCENSSGAENNAFTVRYNGDQTYRQMNDLVISNARQEARLKDIYDKISDNDAALDAEQDKAQAGASSSKSEGDAAIPDNSASLLDGVSGFVTGLAYNGTDCSWTMPDVKLPAISGVMNGVTLIDSQPINFGTWLAALPDGIVIVMRVICSVAVIFFGFKELYKTIEYVLTLRGGGSGE